MDVTDPLVIVPHFQSVAQLICIRKYSLYSKS
jgi:hypothetical protein